MGPLLPQVRHSADERWPGTGGGSGAGLAPVSLVESAGGGEETERVREAGGGGRGGGAPLP